MENEQEAVTNAPEQTVATDSAPVENQTADTQTEPASAITEPEKKVSENVPYERFKEVNDRLKQLEQQISQRVQTPVDYAPQGDGNSVFDEETTQGVLTLAEQAANRAYEIRETKAWLKANEDDLKNPLVDSRTKDLIRSGVERDQALVQAKKEFNQITNPQIAEAKAQGEQEGREIANKKELLGAIGSTASKQELDVNKLSAKEYAEYHGLKYVE